jgi:hypothetical protein
MPDLEPTAGEAASARRHAVLPLRHRLLAALDGRAAAEAANGLARDLRNRSGRAFAYGYHWDVVPVAS